MTANPDPGPPTITVKVFVPSQVEPKEFIWPKTMRVGDAAREVATAFGLTVENPTLQNADGDALDRDKPLVAAGVRDGDCLDLVDAGGGVFQVSRETSLAAVETELPAMLAYAARHHWDVQWMPDELVLVCTCPHPATGDPFRLRADLRGYRAVPPAWTAEPADKVGRSNNRLPQPGATPPGGSSIFHTQCDICAPFNRRAFKDNEGPHSDWGGPTQWLDVRGVAQGRTLADMLAVITAHLRASPGFQS